MAFFDEIGKKISHTGQEAVKQTKIMANVAKYKGNISTLESKIQEVFLQIGRQYFQDHQSDPESDYVVKIEEAKRYFQEIEELQYKIQEEKGVMTCPKCGAEVGTHTVFCSACGAKIEIAVPVQEEKEQRVCSQCGKQVKPGVAFCTSCGAKVSDFSDTM